MDLPFIYLLRAILFHKVLILEVESFSALQEMTGKPVLRAEFCTSPWSCLSAGSQGQVPSASPAGAFPQGIPFLWAFTRVPASSGGVSPKGSEVRLWWAKHRAWNAQVWLLQHCWPLSGVLVKWILSVSLSWWEEQGRYHEPFMENQHSLSCKSWLQREEGSRAGTRAPVSWEISYSECASVLRKQQ